MRPPLRQPLRPPLHAPSDSTCLCGAAAAMAVADGTPRADVTLPRHTPQRRRSSLGRKDRIAGTPTDGLSNTSIMGIFLIANVHD